MNTTYVALVRDHSASMRSLVNGAANDYNLTLDGIRESVSIDNQIAIVSVVECGVGLRGEVRVAGAAQRIENMRHLTSYTANGNATPLWDSVGKAIEEIEALGRNAYGGSTDAFLVMVITDGHENASKFWTAQKISQKIQQLQATDKWTFVFRVPVGAKNSLVRLGIPAGNIMEWEQTETALVQSTVATTSGVKSYFAARSKGSTSTPTFYANVANIKPQVVAQNLIDTTHNFRRGNVGQYQDGMMVRDYCESTFGAYQLGKAFYQLSKTEKVQQQKQLAIMELVSGKIYSGNAARSLLGLPYTGEIRLSPGSYGNYKIFVQSTSVNRKLVKNTEVLYSY